jgi:hypothetical protein
MGPYRDASDIKHPVIIVDGLVPITVAKIAWRISTSSERLGHPAGGSARLYPERRC